jgi:hypothetical protein
MRKTWDGYYVKTRYKALSELKDEGYTRVVIAGEADPFPIDEALDEARFRDICDKDRFVVVYPFDDCVDIYPISYNYDEIGDEPKYQVYK